ncbi:MAG: hypothetical protein LBS79_00770 [Tannerella sp.]|jgi:hypothetical protein|nr:hypothetical protein [Tannerella sp.]
MKDLIISVKRQKTELKWLAGCFCMAFLLNILSIIIYKTSWSEIYSQFLWIFIIFSILYAATCALRIICYVIRRWFRNVQAKR